jgi:hypothetical protein
MSKFFNIILSSIFFIGVGVFIIYYIDSRKMNNNLKLNKIEKVIPLNTDPNLFDFFDDKNKTNQFVFY